MSRRPASAPQLVLVALLCALPACGGEPEPWFREVAIERGLDWSHVRARTQRYWFPEIMGGGVGLLDYDQDGALDVYLVQSGDLAAPDPTETNRLFQNRGGATFADVTGTAGGADPGYGMGCACGDADQDGDTDVYVTKVGPNSLWRNEQGVLRDVTASAGVGDPSWSTSAAWLDHDADGDLDLFVANYVSWSRAQEIQCTSGGPDYCSPLSYNAPTRDTLYRNLGDGTFEDVSAAAGLGAAFGNGLGVVAGDFDDDGRLDAYVANDMLPNQLWLNRGDGTFTDRALFAGCAVNVNGAPEAGMGTVAVDPDDDGDLDLFITHLRDETNTFYRNERGLFLDQTAALGLGAPSRPFTGFGVGFQDFDRDGWLDVYVANGAVTRNTTLYDPQDPYAEPDLLFRGLRTEGDGLRFAEVEPRGGVSPSLIGNGRGAAFGDLDEDGDIDVVVVDNGARVKLLENLARTGHWITLRVLERTGGDAEGARAAIESGSGLRYRWVTSSGSYCSSNDSRVHCGLGTADEPVSVVMRWIDNVEERFGPLAVDRLHVLKRGTGSPVTR